MTVKEIDKGYSKFIESVNKMVNEPHVKAGILGQSGLEKVTDEFTVVDIAATNEFGTEDGRVPERSFIRATIDRRRNRIYGYMYKMMGLVVEGKEGVNNALSRIGELVRGHIDQAITNLRTPPNEPLTINKKGSSNPLIDTGRMRASVSYEVKK